MIVSSDAERQKIFISRERLISSSQLGLRVSENFTAGTRQASQSTNAVNCAFLQTHGAKFKVQ